MNLAQLILISLCGAFLTYLLGKASSRIRDTFAVFISLLLIIPLFCLYGKNEEITYYSFLGLPLILKITPLSWLFAIAVQTITSLSVIFSLSYMKGKERLDFYYLMLLLVNTGMLGIVLSADLISFYIFWEIMSWSTFLLISYNRGPALHAGMKYIVMSIIGSASMIIGILSLYVNCGSLDFVQIASFIPRTSSGYTLFILILFCITFGIKNAIAPFHTWLPDAHSEAPSPFSAVLSGVLIKMGTYGFILFMYTIAGLNIIINIGGGSFHYLISILAAITIIFPTFIAVLQDDAKRLLAWSSIAQVGYIILGIAIGTGLGFVGGVFHFFNHAAFKALLFLSVGAVEYRTGTRDLNSLGGLIKKMPITFFCALIGVFGLIGMPLTNGFVSKWLIYKALILGEHPFLAFIALFGTWGTIIYSYKLIHNIFLGQLPEKFSNVRKAPVTMRIPVIFLSLVVVVFGILPGIPLKIIDTISASFGFQPQDIQIWGIASETGVLNMVNIFAAIFAALIFVWLLFLMGRKKINIAQDDSYAAGAYVPKDKYNYTVDFYKPLSGMIKPYLRDFVDDFYLWLADVIRTFSDKTRKIYCGDLGYYISYIVLFLAVLIVLKMGLKIW
ncbi:MAG: NADH-quinone oxidoreductase subunit M [Deltaproteobacteria bacterium]|nr:NADH-quinone oxidoreductase subunit M [Deltaproteobacteria bacterium]